MRKRSRLVLAAMVLAVVAGLAGAIPLFRLSNPPDPIYDGNRLSYWLEPPTGATSGGWAGRQHFFASLDSNAVPYLVHALKTRDGAVRRAYDGLWLHLPVWLKNHLPAPVPAYATELVSLPGIPALFTSTPRPGPKTSARIRLEACVCLARLGAKARPAMPELIRLLRDDGYMEVRMSAATALGEIANRDDQPAIEALDAATRDSDPKVRDLAHNELYHVKYGSTF